MRNIISVAIVAIALFSWTACASNTIEIAANDVQVLTQGFTNNISVVVTNIVLVPAAPSQTNRIVIGITNSIVLPQTPPSPSNTISITVNTSHKGDGTSFFSHLKDIFVAIAAIITGIAAIFTGIAATLGVEKWKQEIKWKRNSATAIKVLHATYRVRDAFRHVRKPLISISEYPEDLFDDKGNLKQQTYVGSGLARVEEYAYQSRWKVLGQALRELETLNLEAQVLWNEDFDRFMQPFRVLATRLNIAINAHINAVRELVPLSPKERADCREIIYELTEDPADSPFSKQIAEAVQSIAGELRKHISS